MINLEKVNKIYVAGASGMVGSSICRLLNKKGFTPEHNNLLTTKRKDLDLLDSKDVKEWFCKNNPEIVIIAAAKVGGILANSNYPVNFLLENLKIQNNIIESAWENGVKKLIFLGSSCVYPKYSPQPIKEEYLLTSSLEDTNQWYALAKISGIKLCEAFKKQYHLDAISIMPPNLYGPNDNYSLKSGHVMAALIRKFYEAKIRNTKEVICWGSGNPLREFLYVDDFAKACLFIIENWVQNENNSPIDGEGNTLNWLNVGSDEEISIKDLANKISKIIGYQGKIIWDSSKPDGTPRKKLDTSIINKLGWHPSTNLEVGIQKTLAFYIKDHA